MQLGYPPNAKLSGTAGTALRSRRRCDAARDRRNVHHVRDLAAAVGDGPHELWKRSFGDVHQTPEVDVDHLIPFVEGRLDGRAVEHHAGGVDQGIQTAEFGGGAIDQRRSLDRGGKVDLDRQRSATRRTDLPDQSV
jgi:hypothetical protein